MKKILITIALLMMFAGCEKDEYLAPDQDSQISVRTALLDDATASVVVDERAELISFYNGLESTGTLVWPVDDPTSDYCTWDGVYCEGGIVTQLYLQGTDISFGSATTNSLNLTNLQDLYLYSNQLTSVPDFSNLTNLQDLYLHYNQLTSVPDFQYLTNLQDLYLHYNQLTSVPDFQYLTNLQDLSLYRNQLTSVPDFQYLTNLQDLYLYSNQLTSVPDFSNLTNLQDLYLHYNQLTSVPDFQYLTALQRLYLHYNQLTCYPSKWRTNFCGSVYVGSSGNPGLPSWGDFCDYGYGACIENPDEQIVELQTDLDSYIEEGTVDVEGSNSLYNQLNKALTDLCNGEPEKAIGKLEDFIDIVNDKTPDRIDEEVGAEMIAQAEAIIELIVSGDYDLECE